MNPPLNIGDPVTCLVRDFSNGRPIDAICGTVAFADAYVVRVVWATGERHITPLDGEHHEWVRGHHASTTKEARALFAAALLTR